MKNLKIEELEKDIERLHQKYKALKEEARDTRDPDAKIDLDKKAERTYDEWKFKEEELKEIKEQEKQKKQSENVTSISNDFNRSYLNAEGKLLTFDYKATLQRFGNIVEKFGDCGGAGLFVLEKRLSNGGKYCSRKLIHCLSQKTSPGKFFTKTITPIHGEQNEQRFLQKLAEELSVNVNSDFLIRDIIRKIHSLFSENDSGFTHLFYFCGYDSLLKQDNFWNWFIDEFWSKLIQELPNHPYLKLIFLFELDVTIPRNISKACICNSVASFAQNKIVKLPLQKCQKNEIKHWLYNDSGFSRHFCDQVLQTIEEATQRRPDLVYDKFLELLNQ